MNPILDGTILATQAIPGKGAIIQIAGNTTTIVFSMEDLARIAHATVTALDAEPDAGDADLTTLTKEGEALLRAARYGVDNGNRAQRRQQRRRDQ